MKDKKEIIIPVTFDPSLIRRIDLVVPGKPVAKQRPKVVTRGGFARAYTPKPTVDYENLVRHTYKKEYGSFKLDGPIEADITGIFPIPKSTSKKQKALMINNNIKHTKKPDCDNVTKSVLDALNSYAYDDDSQICDLRVRKRYGEEPKVIIKLEKER